MVEKGLLIASVEADSIGEELGIKRGDRLLSINGEIVNDSVEYKFNEACENLVLKIRNNKGETVDFEIEKDFYEEVGFVFEDMVSEPKVCTNNCVFCFVDQMPKGMRKSLYIKDDDSRMSFLQGSFVTLTNMKPEDIDRIIKYRISPINVSIHTTDPELRVSMLKNRFAGRLMEYLKKLSENGIEIKGQIVLCPGINDGDYLKKSVFELSELWPSMSCLAIVPVGVTKYRDGLPILRVVEKAGAEELIDQVGEWQKELLEKLGSRFVYCSDEFYIIGDKPLMDYDDYEGFPQIENGVGLITLFKEEIEMALVNLPKHKRKHKIRELSVLTGEYAAQIMEEAFGKIEQKMPGMSYRIIPVENVFFGNTVKVAGLLTGNDIIRTIEEKNITGNVLITDSMIKEGTDIFLDDIRISDIEKKGVKIHIVREDGSNMVDIISKL